MNAAAEKDVSGVLLDIRLDQATDAAGRPLMFTGTTLAQQMRTMQTLQSLPSVPIVRLSQPDVVKAYIGEDTTSADLFDEAIYKDEIVDDAVPCAKKLVALAEGYAVLRQISGSVLNDDAVATLLGVDLEIIHRLDDRLVSRLRDTAGKPRHEIARLVMNGLLLRSGPLIDEALLATRLGIDRHASSDWATVLERLTTTTYRGVFSGGYTRWWMIPVLDWWSALGAAKSLQRTAAEARVTLIRATTQLSNLVPISVTDDSPGERFWARCSATGVAVDPQHGIVLLPAEKHEPWQDSEYLSLEAALRSSRTNARISSRDKAVLQAQKERRNKP